MSRLFTSAPLWQKGFYDRKRKETVTGKAPIGGSPSQRSCQRTQGTDTAADTRGCYFGESISAVSTNDFGTTGGFFMRDFGIDTMKFGRSGQPGRFSFSTRGRTYSPPAIGGRWYPSRWSESCAFRGGCGSFGRLWTMPHFCAIAVIVHAVGALFATEIAALFRAAMYANCLRKPATGSFSQRCVSLRRHPFSFCEKETKTRTKER